MYHFLIFLRELGESFVTLVRVVFMTKFCGKRKINKVNKDCLILGNGPSLKLFLENNYDDTRGKDVVAVNFFWKSEYFTKLKPRHYLINSLNYWNRSYSDFNASGRNETFKQLAAQVTWKMYLLVPAFAKKKKEWKKEIGINKNIKVIYFNQTPIEGFKWFKNILLNFNFGMPRPHNVLIPALKNMIDFKYKNIYLVGADHSWLSEINVTEDNVVLLRQIHFYDKKVKPDIMPDGRDGIKPLHDVLLKFAYSFRGYHELKAYANWKKVSVYNATKGSLIDAFERIDLSKTIDGR
ncbi:MAG: hypothetical protein KQH79_00320 [Bacteroidetes bacterium]|nr:hypothetical protein [Bacteroidota bacterium]